MLLNATCPTGPAPLSAPLSRSSTGAAEHGKPERWAPTAQGPTDASLFKHWRRVDVHSIASGHIRQGSHIPPPLLQFVVTALPEGAPTSEAEQQQFLAASPWLVDSKCFESALFEPPDDPTTSFAQAFKDSAESARSLAKLAMKHADDADLIGDMFKNKEDLLRCLYEEFTQLVKEEIPQGGRRASFYGPQFQPGRFEQRRSCPWSRRRSCAPPEWPSTRAKAVVRKSPTSQFDGHPPGAGGPREKTFSYPCKSRAAAAYKNTVRPCPCRRRWYSLAAVVG